MTRLASIVALALATLAVAHTSAHAKKMPPTQCKSCKAPAAKVTPDPCKGCSHITPGPKYSPERKPRTPR